MLRLVFILSFLLAFGRIFAQEPAKKHLSIDDFAGWKNIENELISNNGNYISYELNQQKGDGKLILYHNNTNDTIARGYNASFGADNNYLVFRIKQPADSIKNAKSEKVDLENLPADSIGILIFKTHIIKKFPSLRSYKVGEGISPWVAFLSRQQSKVVDSLARTNPPSKNKDEANHLILFNTQNLDTLKYEDVTEYFYSKNGNAVFFVRQTSDSTRTKSSLYKFNTNAGTNNLLFFTEGRIEKLVSDNTGTMYAFLLTHDSTISSEYSIYLGQNRTEPERIADKYKKGIPLGWSPSAYGNVVFSDNGTKLYFGNAETPEKEVKDTIPEDEKPVLDVWNWKDLKLQPQQKVEAEKEKKRTYLAVYNINDREIIQLEDVNVKKVSTIQKGNGDIGLGQEDTPYLKESSWTGINNHDYYLVDFKSGIKWKILKKKSYVQISPQGKYIVWYEPTDSSFYAKSTNINNLETTPLTKMIPVSFHNELNDRPMAPNPYGIAGWAPDDRFVYIYDRYDIWRLDPSGERVPVCITSAFGRRNKIRLRYLKLNKDLEYIPIDKQVILKAFDERTMSSGFFSAQFNLVKQPNLLRMEKYWFEKVQKAKEADKLIYTKESVAEYPDIWSSNLKFEQNIKISEANPQQGEYVWPKAELVEWKSFSGENLKGILYMPENVDPAKKYPMVVYYYERNSENLYQHQIPSPSRSTINKTFYTSNNFLVFVPDITFKIGYPGQSAFNAIVSGTQYLVDHYSFVDGENIGLQGQSWGGYETAYVITRTDIYKAAMAGAPVSNMTSAYGGIRWETGLSRMFQYEQTQSRIGGTLWDKPLNYIENSPLFYAPKINTPLLIMHNDNDGAVPWYQGIELFVALRRLEKPVWMLSYNREPHNLRSSSWANRIDLSKRMFQFFNHYLKSKSMPEWMDKGIPATEKGENMGY